MVKVKDLTELTLPDLWKGCNEFTVDDEYCEEINRRTLKMVKVILEQSMEAELMEKLQASRYLRTEGRKGYRNGYYERSLFSQFGVINALRVPRARESCELKVLARYQRRQEKINHMVRQMFLSGVSTRRVGELLEVVWGGSISAQTVSRICRSLDSEVAAWQQRSLQDRYRYLFFDGIHLRVKGALQVRRIPVLVAYGITDHGVRELLAFRQATSESEAQWEALLRTLYDRGLQGWGCSMIIIDGCAGLHRALETVYPYIPLQRCWAHKLRNVSNYLRRSDQKQCIGDARLIYMADTKRAAVRAFKEWQHTWKERYPKANHCLAVDMDELLNFMECPQLHQVKVRTTNVIERSFREIRRRTRPMSCFTNAKSVDRIIYGVITHLNKNWQEKPLHEFTQNT